jgi:P27 family predicted phage terminase small subunit
MLVAWRCCSLAVEVEIVVRGRPKSNPVLLEREGYYRKHPERRERSSVETVAEPGRPLPTLMVQGDELTLAIWEETCSTLESMGILKKTDSLLVEVFCLNLREMYALNARIREKGHAQLSDDGTTKTCPEVVSWHKLVATHIKLLGELALTPQARLRMVAPEVDNESSNSVSDLMKKLGGK